MIILLFRKKSITFVVEIKKDMETKIIVHNWNHEPQTVVWEHIRKAIDLGILNHKLNDDKGSFHYNDYNNSGIEIDITYKQRK